MLTIGNNKNGGHVISRCEKKEWNTKKCWTEKRLHSFKFSDGYKSTMPMDWCSVYLAPQALPKYMYLSPPLIFPTTYNGIRTKTRPRSNHCIITFLDIVRPLYLVYFRINGKHLLVQNTTVLTRQFNSSIIKTYWMYLNILLNSVQTI
jgi:hypothetical protein